MHQCENILVSYKPPIHNIQKDSSALHMMDSQRWMHFLADHSVTRKQGGGGASRSHAFSGEKKA